MDKNTPHKFSSDNCTVGIVIIGRNEGERLRDCIRSAVAPDRPLVYVDSGSDDGSVETAKALGAEVVELDMGLPFTAARARNAGYARLNAIAKPKYVQFVDGDCTLAPAWVDESTSFLDLNPEVAVVCGRRREKNPERTIYNRLVDREWATPIGDALSCGGDALMRCEPFNEVNGYDASLIAGEEPELCVRLRAAGWKIHRLDTEMTSHDIAMTSLGQWLKRARRAGHAFAEVSNMHRKKPENIWTSETMRAFLWSGLGVVAILAAIVLHPAALVLLLAYPLQIARMAVRDGVADKTNWIYAALIVMQKPWEAAGAMQFWARHIGGGDRTIIEYRS